MTTEIIQRPLRKRLGLNGYAAAFVRLRAGASEDDLRHEGFISSKFNVKRFVASLYKVGRLRIKEWRMEPSSPLKAVYCHADAEPDAMPPKFRANGGRVKSPHIPMVDVVPSELLAFCSFLDAIEDRVLTRKQIRERTGLDEITINKTLDALMPTCAHLCGWVAASNGTLAAAYTLGGGKNKKRPAIKSSRTRQRESRRRAAIRRGVIASPMLQMAAFLAPANDLRVEAVA